MPGENEKKRLFEVIEKKDCGNYSKYYKKWVEKEKDDVKMRVLRNLKISCQKIQQEKVVYDVGLWTVMEEKEGVYEKFCEDLCDRVNNMKYFFNEFVFVFDKVQTNPQKIVFSRYKSEYQVILSFSLKKIHFFLKNRKNWIGLMRKSSV